MQKLNMFSVGAVAALMFVGCAQGQSPAADSASSISEGVCKSGAKTAVYDEMFRLAESGTDFPQASELTTALTKSLKAQSGVRASDDAQIESMAGSLASIASDIANETETPSSVDDEEAQLHLSKRDLLVRRLARLELGDHSSDAKVKMQARIAAASAQVKQMAATTLDCSSSGGSNSGSSSGSGGTTPVRGTLLDEWKSSQNPSVYGAWKTMAIAYQSCNAVGVAPLSASSPSTVGVTILTTKVAASGGYWREVTNLTEFLDTNPYYKNYSAPSSSCFAVESHPLIYDFGGKPSTTSTTINLFANAGSGATTSLGVDCSGFIATTQLSAGLKPKSSTDIRPSYAGAISSNDFRDPSGSLDLDCLQKASFTPSAYQLMPGDIIAINGHVLMVDTVGADPFGMAKLTSASQCTNANIAVKNFDFSLIQSSPYKGAIGIQRSVASDYVPSDSTIANGLVSYGIAACKARFGTSSTPSISTLSIVRHSTSAACSSTEVPLTDQACVASCPAQ